MVNAQPRSAQPASSPSRRRVRATVVGLIAIVAVASAAATGCGDVNAALTELSEARDLAADIQVQFTKAADAANRAVMADTDEASVTYSREAEEAKLAVQKDVDALGPKLRTLNYSDETRLLDEFVARFTEYRALDRRILDLAVENTNLKAQRLSFGPAQEAADAFRDALEAAASSVPAKDTLRADALVARAVATVREIQVLQAPHIADADNTVMTRMETRMATSETAARKALEQLVPLVPAASPSHLTEAAVILDRFVGLNQQIIALSRRNTNVHSVALSLDQKRTRTAACETSLRALRDALAKRGFTGTRKD